MMRTLRAGIQVLLVLVSLGSTSPALARVVVGEEAPDFTLQDVDGHSYTLSDYRGKAVLLTFIGYNCVRCLSSGPAVEQVWLDYKSSGVFQTLAVDVWNGSVAGVRSYITQTGATYPVLMGGGYLMIDDQGSYGLRNDNYLVLDASGIVRYSSDEGPYVTTRFDDAQVRGTINAWLPLAVESTTWQGVKSLYR